MCHPPSFSMRLLLNLSSQEGMAGSLGPGERRGPVCFYFPTSRQNREAHLLVWLWSVGHGCSRAETQRWPTPPLRFRESEASQEAGEGVGGRGIPHQHMPPRPHAPMHITHILCLHTHAPTLHPSQRCDLINKFK